VAVEAEGLAKTYRSRTGAVEAVRGVDPWVEAGEVFGFLGPNGAGKVDDSADADDAPFAHLGQRSRCRVATSRASSARALDADPLARAAYDRLPEGRKREQVRTIESAKKADTRTRRIEKGLAALRESEPAGRAAARGNARTSKSTPGEP
jgi:Bacteriocin-protection, YdeI or OmpD-Associated